MLISLEKVLWKTLSLNLNEFGVLSHREIFQFGFSCELEEMKKIRRQSDKRFTELQQYHSEKQQILTRVAVVFTL